MLLNEAISAIVDTISNNINNGILGTNGQVASPTDTGVISAVAATSALATTSISGNQITISFTKLSTVGANTLYREYAIRDTVNNVDYTRFVFTGQTALPTDDWNIKVRLFVRSA